MRNEAIAAAATTRLAGVTSGGVARQLWRGSAAMFGIAVGLALAFGDVAATLWGALVALCVIRLATSVSRVHERSALVTIAALALGIRFVLALAIHGFATGYGGGFVTGDDAAYFRVSSNIAAYLTGGYLDPAYAPPHWGGDAYLIRTFVFLESGLFLLFGPDVRIPLLLNAGISVATALIIYSATSRMFAGHAAIIASAIAAFIPSLLIWSVLNLKDALTVGLAVGTIWSLGAMHARPRVWIWAVVVSFVAAELLTGLRSYVAAAVALAMFAAALLLPVDGRRRVGASGLSALLMSAVLLQVLAAVGFGDQLLATLEHTRQSMAVGARTAFVPTPTPLPTFEPAATVQPGPATDRVPTASSTELAPAARTLTYLPKGIAYALFAPFPWAAQTIGDVVVVPEMLLWYALLVGSLVTLWRERNVLRRLVPVVVTAVILVGVLALAEGNTGTLFRHRGMLLPLAAMLASPAIAMIGARLGTKRPP